LGKGQAIQKRDNDFKHIAGYRLTPNNHIFLPC
jgi:hypothetical protein